MLGCTVMLGCMVIFGKIKEMQLSTRCIKTKNSRNLCLIIEECYPEINGFAETYFDYSKFERDLFISDYYFDNGFVFKR